jgi:hypothetical protein
MFRSLFIHQGFVYDYQYDWSSENAPLQIAPEIALIKMPMTLSSQLIAKRGAVEAAAPPKRTEQLPHAGKPPSKQTAPKRVAVPEEESGVKRKWTVGVIASRVKETRPDENRVLPFRSKSKEKKWVQPTREATPRRIARDASCRRTMLPSWMQKRPNYAD